MATTKTTTTMRTKPMESPNKKIFKNGYHHHQQQQQQPQAHPPNHHLQPGQPPGTVAAATGSLVDGVPSHVGLVHAMLGGNCIPEAGYDSGSVGGVGGAGSVPPAPRSPQPQAPSPSPAPVDGMTSRRSHAMSDPDNSDREEQPFDRTYRDCDVDTSSQADTSQAEDTSQADTSQDLGHSDRDSIAGYHTDTGAMSDGNSTTRQYHPASRGGSVGGMSERSRSSGGAGSTTNDRPPAKVTIARPRSLSRCHPWWSDQAPASTPWRLLPVSTITFLRPTCLTVDPHQSLASLTMLPSTREA